jgi:hypothetical protein
VVSRLSVAAVVEGMDVDLVEVGLDGDILKGMASQPAFAVRMTELELTPALILSLGALMIDSRMLSSVTSSC